MSGSSSLSSTVEKEKIKNRFKGAVSFDMETFMWSRIYEVYDVPFLSIRGVSDNGEESPEGSYLENCRLAGYRAGLGVLKEISSMNSSSSRAS